jgi:hypothetical protein
MMMMMIMIKHNIIKTGPAAELVMMMMIMSMIKHNIIKTGPAAELGI